MTRVNLATAFPANSDWPSAGVRDYLQRQAVHSLADATELRNSDMEMVNAVLLRSTGVIYTLNLSSSAADDGDTVIHDAISRRYEKLNGGVSLAFDASGTLAGRAAHDAEAQGFSYAVTDGAALEIYVKESAASGDWSAAFSWTGPQGPAGLDLTPEVYGASTLWKVVENATASAVIRMYRSHSVTSGQTARYLIKAKHGKRGRLGLYSNQYAAMSVVFNLWTGVATILSGAATATMTKRLNGMWDCEATVLATGTGASLVQIAPLDESNLPSAPTRAGDGVSELYLKSAEAWNGATVSWASDTDNFAAASWTKNGMPTPTSAAATYLGISGQSGEGYNPLAVLTGKKVTVLGTSLVSQGKWTVPFANRTGCVLTNLGVGGASLGAASNGHYGSLVVTTQLASIPADAEIIIIDQLVNDFGAASVPLGAVTDTSTATYAGALYNAASWCDANRPNARLMFAVQTSAGPAHATHSHAAGANSAGFTLRQYQQMTRDMADMLGRPCIDLNRYGISMLDADQNTSDDLHYDTDGGLRVALIYADFLRDLVQSGWLD